jgi:hypothetical protein
VVGQWRVGRGDTALARADAEALRSDARLADPRGVAEHAWCSLLLEAQLAAATESADAVERIRALDSLSRTGPVLRASMAWAPLAVARLLEGAGMEREALAAVRRRGWFGRWPRYLAEGLREEGRLALAAGDTAGAVTAWRRYLALHDEPEPARRAERERVREALVRLR